MVIPTAARSVFAALVRACATVRDDDDRFVIGRLSFLSSVCLERVCLELALPLSFPLPA